MKTLRYRSHFISRIGILLFSFIFVINSSTVFCADPIVAGYYPSYRHSLLPADKLQLKHLTHIMHSFAYPDINGKLLHPDNFIYPELIQRVHDEGKEIFVALGGGGNSGDFSTAVADSTTRSFFVDNIIEFYDLHGYDGVDIDWERPLSNADKSNLNKFVYELKQKKPDLSISVTLGGSAWASQYFDLSYLVQYVDWFGIMAYGMHGPWSSVSGHNAALYAPVGQNSVENYTDNMIINKNIPADKIVMGIPFYGYSFESSSLGAANSGATDITYSNVLQKIVDGWTYIWDDFAKVPYLVDPDQTKILSFDDVRSVGLKCDYIKERNLAGTMIWEISQDYLAGDQPLLETVGINMLQSLGDLTSSVEITYPANGAQFESGDNITIAAEAGDSLGSVSKVEFYLGSTKLGESFNPPYEYTWEITEKGFQGLKALAYNNLGVATPSERVYIVANAPTSDQTPFNGVPSVIPGTIESEDFDEGGENVSYHDTTPGNTGNSYRTDVDVDIEPCSKGGYNVGYIADGEWLEYTVDVDATGLYDINFSVASNLDGGAFHLELDGQDVTETITTPGTGGWGVYKIITTTDVELTVGEHILRLYVEKFGFNINNMIFTQNTVSITGNSEQAISFKLHNNYPNPFNPSTNIRFDIPKAENVTVKIYSVNGQEIATLVNRKLNAGQHNFEFNASKLPSGIYIYRIEAGSFIESKKMILLK